MQWCFNRSLLVLNFHETIVYNGLKRINKAEKSLSEIVLKTALLLEEACHESKLEESYRVYIRDYAKYSHYVKLISRDEYGPIKAQIQSASAIASDPDTYFIEPIQRICRYPLLLQRVLKEAQKINFDQVDKIEKAFEVVKRSTESINALQSTADRRVEAREESIIRKTSK